jgi:hypothetical protein
MRRNALIGGQMSACVVGTLHAAVAAGDAAGRHLRQNPLTRDKIMYCKSKYLGKGGH